MWLAEGHLRSRSFPVLMSDLGSNMIGLFEVPCRGPPMYVCMHASMYVHMHISIYIYTYIYVQIYTCIYVRSCMHMHAIHVGRWSCFITAA